MSRTSRLFRGRLGPPALTGDPIARIGGANLIVNLDANDFTGGTTWTDRAGQNDFVAFVGFGQVAPTKVTAPMPGVYSSGNVRMPCTKASGNFIASGTPRATILAVMNVGAAPTTAVMVGTETTPGTTYWRMHWVGPDQVRSRADGYLTHTTITLSTPVLVESTVGALANHVEWGANQATGGYLAAINQNLPTMSIFNQSNGAGGSEMTVHQVLLGTFTDDQITALRAHLTAKWGL